MKKLSLYMISLMSAALVGCSDKYDPEVGPQTYLPESPVQMSDVSVTNTASSIKIADFIDADTDAETAIEMGSFSVKEGAMPANTIMKAEIEISQTEDFAKSAIVPVNSLAETDKITVQPSDLENAYFDYISKNPATTDLYVRTIMYTVTKGDAAARIGNPETDFFASAKITLTPLDRVKIAPDYYIIGGPNDWAGSAANRSIKFEHSGEDVYVDPIFTVIFDAAASGDTWFAIGDDEACDAIGSGDWSKLYGIVGGENTAESGELDRRYNLGGDNSFCVPAGAKKIKVTIDMMEQTFIVESINISDSYYLIGGPGEWNAESAMTMKFSHSNKSVFEDPVFTYMFDGTGSDMWFAIGDKDAIDAIGAGTDGAWSKLLGQTAGNGENGLTGTIAPRTKLSDDGSFKVDGKAKHYRITINMLEMTFEIAELNFEPFVYFIGATDGWANAEQKLALTDEANGIYTGFVYCADPNGWGNEFKFQKVAGDWGTEINTGHMTGGITGDFADGGGNFKANAGEGVYFVTLNLGTNSIDAVKVNKMGLIGDFNSWAGDTEMTWNATDYCFEVTGAAVTAAGWKFRVNADWAINLGGATLDNLVANGDNIFVAGSTVKLYPTRKTSDKIYCTVE
jgi:hypothetical protein